ncbi:MAG: pyridoxamine 5'-phosphate oxidase family protein [Candidatus Omnitrophota bacterium]
MSLNEYFNNTEGIGILATSNSDGRVDTALYAKPHFIDEKRCIFLMADKCSHINIKENPHASYIFIEKTGNYKGKRLSLTKTKEFVDEELASQIRKKKHGCPACDEDKKTFIVYFKVDFVRPLVGDSEK